MSKYLGAMKLRGGARHLVRDEDAEIFRFADYAPSGPWLSGVHNLLRPLTINSITVDPTFWYKGEDGNASAGTWASEYGGVDGILSQAGAGASPSYAQDTPLLGTDKAIKYPGAKYHAVAGNAFGDITIEDFVLEFVVKWSTANTKQMFGKCVGGATGYMAYESSDQIRFLIGDASGGTAIASAALTHDTWYHGMVFCDRSGSGQIYINGVASGAAVDISARQLTLTTATTFKIGLAVGQLFDGSVSQCAMWQRAAWLDTHLQATVAAQRFRALTGFRPQVSNAGVDTAPLSYTRATNATLQKYDAATAANKFFTVGSGWLRAERWAQADGYRAELASTNKITYSHVTQGTWTKADAGDTTTAVDGPWGTGSAEGWVADATDGPHRRYVACTTTAAAHVFWARVKAGAVGWGALYDAVSGVGQFFNLATGALGGTGTWGAPTSSYMVSEGDGWWIVAMVYTATAAARNVSIYPAEADGDVTFAGDGVNPSILFAHAQCELGVVDSSAIRTSGGTGTRNVDVLVYSATTTPGGLSVVMDVVERSISYKTGLATRVLVNVSDGGTTNNTYACHLTNTTNYQIVCGADGNTSTVTEFGDGVLRRVGWTLRLNSLQGWISGAAVGVPDTSVAAIAATNRVSIGCTYGGAYQPSSPMLIRRVRVYDTYRTDMAKLTTL